ncbi:MAG: alpha/beta hydrolase [Alphaproteobacteria bacterium]|nr:alpha/beta hydrolase [Alphaproteobacteria bacterium]
MNVRPPKFGFITHPSSVKLAYEFLAGQNPGIVYLGGFQSSMSGVKASVLRQLCIDHGRQFLRFDYRDHGLSSPDPQASIGAWRDDSLFLIDHLTTGDLILVGSSMGGWLMMLLALIRPARIKGLIGLAAAPDFTERLIRPSLSLSQKRALDKTGITHIQSPYSQTPYQITSLLLADSQAHLVLSSNKLQALSQPLLLFHGTADSVVPWRLSYEVLERTTNLNNCLTLLNDGDHRLSGPEHIDIWLSGVKRLCQIPSNPCL